MYWFCANAIRSVKVRGTFIFIYRDAINFLIIVCFSILGRSVTGVETFVSFIFLFIVYLKLLQVPDGKALPPPQPTDR